MKRLFLLLIIGFTNLILAQSEFLNQSNTISGSKISLPPSKSSAPKSFAPSIFTPNSNIKSSSTIPQKSTLQFANNNKFANPGDVYKDKLNKTESGENFKVFRTNINYGDIKIKSNFVNIKYRDFGFIDGDIIEIFINDKLIKSQIILEGDFEGFELGLEKGFNKIDFVAVNEGTSSPNTAEFQIFNDKGIEVYRNMWNMATGIKATLIIVRE